MEEELICWRCNLTLNPRLRLLGDPQLAPTCSSSCQYHYLYKSSMSLQARIEDRVQILLLMLSGNVITTMTSIVKWLA